MAKVFSLMTLLKTLKGLCWHEKVSLRVGEMFEREKFVIGGVVGKGSRRRQQ